jgi:hypothetical protein
MDENQELYAILEDGNTKEQDSRTPDEDFDREQWAQDKKRERDDLYEQLDKVSMNAMRKGTTMQGYLKVQSRMSNLSAGNALLVYDAMPDAAKVATYDTWRAQDASVNKGEKAHVTIFEPGREYERPDGTTGTSYDPVKVFDISQTNAAPEARPRYDMPTLLRALIKDCPATIGTVESLPPKVCATYDADKNAIAVLEGLDGAALFKAMTIQVANVNFAKYGNDFTEPKFRNAVLLSSYMVCERYGVDNRSMSFDTLPGLFTSITEPKQAREQLSLARDGFVGIVKQMDKALEKETPIQDKAMADKDAATAEHKPREHERDAR